MSNENRRLNEKRQNKKDVKEGKQEGKKKNKDSKKKTREGSKLNSWDCLVYCAGSSIELHFNITVVCPVSLPPAGQVFSPHLSRGRG
jgi:hypothetical protein